MFRLWILVYISFFVPSFALADNTPAPTPFDPNHIQIETDEKLWKKLSDEEGIRTYQERESTEDVVAFRGETTLPTSLERIVTVLRDESLRKEWVDSLEETSILEKISNLEQIEYNHTRVPWPFQDRDFVFRAKVTVHPEAHSLLIYMHSVENDLAPKKKGIIRGEVLHCFYFMKEIPGPEPKTDILIEMAVDPKGSIPKWMVNLTQKRWPHNTFRALKKMATDPDLVIPKEIKEYFK